MREGVPGKPWGVPVLLLMLRVLKEVSAPLWVSVSPVGSEDGPGDF